MQKFGLEEFKRRACEFDAAVAVTPNIATYCSGSDWILAAHKHLHPPRPLLAFEKNGHWVVLAAGDFYNVPNALQPVEAAWCFNCSLAGPNPRKSVELLHTVINRQKSHFDHLILSGIPMFSPLHGLIRSQRENFRLQWSFPGIDCLQASLEGGLNGYLRRRSAHFRAAARTVKRKVEKAGLRFQYIKTASGSDGDSLFARILKIEKLSWKQEAAESVFLLEDHRHFYREIFQCAAADGRLRVVFGQNTEGADIADIAGGILGETYRGFQMGFDDQYAAHSPGNLAQLEMIAGLAGEGIEVYDLGMAIDYKKRWAENLLRLTNIIIVL